MRYLDYQFGIDEHGIEFLDRGEDKLESEHIRPGMVLRVEYIGPDDRLYLRVIDSDTLDYYMYV